jgi:hypothetical protein
VNIEAHGEQPATGEFEMHQVPPGSYELHLVTPNLRRITEVVVSAGQVNDLETQDLCFQD